MKTNVNWVSKVEITKYNEVETLTCYNEQNEELIKIRIGLYQNGRKIYDITFCKKDCDLIEELENILSDKLKELRGKVVDNSINYWQNKVLGRSKNITSIYNKVKNNEKLGIQELYILYGLYSLREMPCDDSLKRGYNVGYFGFNIDPRIFEILKNRDHQSDFLHFTEDEQIELLKAYVSGDDDSKFFNISLDNKRVVTEAMALQYASDTLLSNPKFIRKYIAKSSVTASVLKYTKANINKNKKIVMLVLQSKSNDDFKYVDDSLKNDKEVALTAVRYNGLMYEYVGDSLKEDKDIIITALLQNMEVTKFININILKKYVEVRIVYYIISMVNSYSKLSNDRKEKVKDDLFKLINLAPTELKENSRLMRKAYVINKNVYDVASDNVKKRLK